MFFRPAASSGSESSTWASMARLVLNRANGFIHIHKGRYWIGLRVYIPMCFQRRESLFVLVSSEIVRAYDRCVCAFVRACVRACVPGSVRSLVSAETSR